MSVLFHNEMVWACLKALVISLILTPIFRDMFRSYHIVDRPGPRRVHVHPIPRVGGIPIAIAYAVSLISFSDLANGFGGVAWKLIPGAALVFLTGLADDLYGLKPLYKLAGQIAAALLVFASGVRIDVLGHSLPPWLDLPLTLFWLLLATNALNLIDGLDGLCAGIGLVATLALFGAAMLHGNLPLAHAILPLAGALVGFLFYNVSPATVFLGDSGALLIGFLLGCYGMVWTQKTATLLSLLVPLLALSIPLLDVFLAVLRRLLGRQPIFSADRAHIHHRLLDRGLTPGRAVLVLYLLAGVAAGFVLLLNSPIAARYENVLLLVAVAVLLLSVRQLGDKEFSLARRALFERQPAADQKLEKLGKALNQARTEEEWWSAIAEAAREAQWLRLIWTGPHNTREAVLSQGEAAWNFRVPLGGAGLLEVHGSCAGAQIDLSAFAEIVKRNSPTHSVTHRQEGEELAVR